MEDDRRDVTDWSVMAVEFTGVDARNWLADPSRAREDDKSAWWLFKEVKMGQVMGPGRVPLRQYRRVDDRVEKLACGLAKLLALPSAEIALVRRGGAEGLISHNVATTGWSLQPADVVLSEYPGYVSCGSDRKMRERPGHNMANIELLLDAMLGPPASDLSTWRAFDVFVGYLVFDAWIANTDRHAFNWAVLLSPEGDRLAPSFDHGSALGSGLEDASRARWLSQDVGSWCSKGLARRFEGGRSVTLVELAVVALTRASAQAASWIEMLGDLKRDEWQALISGIPGMSVVEGTFVDEVLEANRRRLCDEYRRAR